MFAKVLQKVPTSFYEGKVACYAKNLNIAALQAFLIHADYIYTVVTIQHFLDQAVVEHYR